MRPRGTIALVLPGGLHRTTGGNLYDRAVLRTLRERGWETAVLEPERLPPRCDLVVVDSLALRHGPPRTTAPVVALVHQVPSEANGRPGWMAGERSTLRSCRLVITVSEWLRRRVETMTPTPILVIPPGRDRTFSGNPSSLEDGVVLCVANGVRGKGVPEAIEAVRATGDPRAGLVVVGDVDVDPGEADRIDRAVGAGGARIRLTGVLSSEELAGWYSRARLLLTASRYEGWPIAVAEAMAAGLPVAGFDIPGIRELVRPGRDGLLVEPGDVPALGRAVASLLADRALASSLAAEALERARSWPTWKETGERFADCVETVVRSFGRPGAPRPRAAAGYVKGGAPGGPA